MNALMLFFLSRVAFPASSGISTHKCSISEYVYERKEERQQCRERGGEQQNRA